MEVTYYLDKNTGVYKYQIRQIYTCESSNQEEIIKQANFDMHQHTAEMLVRSFKKDFLTLKGIDKLHEAEYKILANIQDSNLAQYIGSIFKEIYNLNESNNKAELRKTYMPVRQKELEDV